MYSLPILLTGLSPLVTVGQPVKKGDAVASGTHLSEHVINISHALNVPLRKVKSYLKKHPGDIIFRGEVLAVKPGVLGMGGERILSEVEGKVAFYKTETGEIVIHKELTPDQAQTTLISPVDGTVILCDNEKIVIQTASPVVAAKNAIGKHAEAELVAIHPDQDKELKYFEIDVRVAGKILLAGKVTKESLLKAIGMNVAGILTTHMPDDELSYIEQKYHVPVMIIHDVHYDYFNQISGRQLYLDGISKSIVIH